MNEKKDWKSFLLPYELAVGGFIIKFEAIKKEYILRGERSPIEIVSGRVKSIASIFEKAERLNVSISQIPEEIYDIAGIRITCKYLEDVYKVYDLLCSRKDTEIFLVKDYVKNPKPSGYRSLHIIAKYNVETIDGQIPINIEFQIRTHAMHLWASVEHSLKYKYYHNIPENIKERLVNASLISSKLDEELSLIKEAIDMTEVENSREEEYSLDDLEIFLGNIRK